MQRIEVPELIIADNVYLRIYLGAFRDWLDDENVTEILVNRPGEVWIERSGEAHMQCIADPSIDDCLIERLAQQVAHQTQQGINHENPLLGATLPNGARIQIVAPPATRKHWAMAIRRHRQVEVPLEAYAQNLSGLELGDQLRPRMVAGDAVAYLREVVAAKGTILISGGTSSGKTTFLNALLREVPANERIVLVEDTPEVQLAQCNVVSLVAVKGKLGKAQINVADLLEASLRLRPDRIVLGEMRGAEAVSFLRAINTGHRGSFSTIHANSPAGALEQVALMVMQSGLGLSRQDTIAYAKSMIDVVVQLDRVAGVRKISGLLEV